MKINSLKEVIAVNTNFRTAINLYLNLNDRKKVMGYIPTKSSVSILNQYLDAIVKNKEQATLLVGSYGKGKSHLLLVLLAILSMDRSEENKNVIEKISDKIKNVDEVGKVTYELIEEVWEKKFLPVLITDMQGDLNQAFLYAINDALKREGLNDIAPDTFYSVARERINTWEAEFPDTYASFVTHLQEYRISISEFLTGLSLYEKKAMDIFREIYPKLTAGSDFNPLSTSEIVPLYKNISEKLCEEFGYNGIYIVFDEFSKFIEGQDGISTGKNMMLLQSMCELAAESNSAQIFITLVAHKSIKEYGKYLPIEIINAFTGIEGRLTEKYFVASSKNNYELIKNAIEKNDDELRHIPEYNKLFGEKQKKEYYQIPVFNMNFNELDFENIILRGCFPLSPISSYLLLNISEKVAQNERTLFTFISNDEPCSMVRYVEEHTIDMPWNIGADLVYDYFRSLFRKETVNENVHNEWLNAEYAISKCETDDQIKIIKALAIILIVNKEDELPAEERYICMSVFCGDAHKAIEELQKLNLIYKKGSTNAFLFKTRAGSQLKAAIKKQREIIGTSVNYAWVLQEVSQSEFLLPRKYNSEHYMTRYFRHEFMHVDDFLCISNPDAFFDESEFSDGKVISLYSDKNIIIEQVKRHVQKLASEKVIVVCPKRPVLIFKQARDYEIIHELKKNVDFIKDNELLLKEIPILEDDLTNQIVSYIREVYEDTREGAILYFAKGRVKKLKINQVEEAINRCCENIYFKTPIINNEMINRQVISTAQTKKARLNIVQCILRGEVDEDYYSGTSQEATIFRSLFCKTGLLNHSEDILLTEIIGLMNDFIISCCDRKKQISSLVQQLTTEPYGLRKGILPIYFAYVLSKRNEDIVAYFMEMEVQLDGNILVNMFESPNDYFIFVSEEDLQKEKYISSLNTLYAISDNRNLSDNRIKNIALCMQRWFRALPLVTRNAVSYSDFVKDTVVVDGMLVMKRMLQKVEFNPYEFLFVNIPEELNLHNDLGKCFEVIKLCKNAFDGYYDWIVNQALIKTKEIYSIRNGQDLYHGMHEWYENQSDLSKQGLHSGRITNLMTCIEKLSVFGDIEVLKKIIKASIDVYIENWNDRSFEEYISLIRDMKQEIESIREESVEDKMELIFTSRNGILVKKIYERTSDDTGVVLKNIIEDALDEYDDLSVNDRVVILLEMIEKIIG